MIMDEEERIDTEEPSSKVKWKDSRLHELFYKAVVKQDKDLVVECLRYGANVNRHFPILDYQTVLHLSSRLGHWKLTFLFCTEEIDADPNVTDIKNFTPLHYACLGGNTKDASILIASGANVLIQNYYGDSPIHTASRYRREKILLHLLKIRYVMVPSRRKRLAGKITWWRGPDPDESSSLDGYEVAMNDYDGLGNEIRTEQFTPTRKRRFSALYHSEQAETEAGQSSPTRKRHFSAEDHSDQVDKRKLYRRSEADTYVDKLVEHVNLQNSNGDTPLHIAVALNQENLVRLLLDHGASVFICNMQGDTALHLAISKQHYSIQETLEDQSGGNYPPEPPLEYRDDFDISVTIRTDEEIHSNLEHIKHTSHSADSLTSIQSRIARSNYYQMNQMNRSDDEVVLSTETNPSPDSSSDVMDPELLNTIVDNSIHQNRSQYRAWQMSTRESVWRATVILAAIITTLFICIGIYWDKILPSSTENVVTANRILDTPDIRNLSKI